MRNYATSCDQSSAIKDGVADIRFQGIVTESGIKYYLKKLLMCSIKISGFSSGM
jgi:hypothetical protein